MTAIGYEDPLPVPTPAIQATLAAIHPREIHEYIQGHDKEALGANSEEGEAPTFLAVLDLGQWTRIFEVANSDPAKGLTRLGELKDKLIERMILDTEELEKAISDTAKAELAIRKANCLAAPVTGTDLASQGSSGTFASGSTVGNILSHPFLQYMVVTGPSKAALEDFQESITSSQIEKDQAALIATGKSLAIPFEPARAVEETITYKDHRVWAHGNINLLAPVPFAAWRIWAGLSKEEVSACKEHSLKGTQCIGKSEDLISAFSLYTYDHGKCSTPDVKLHVKLDLPTQGDRKEKHAQELWNQSRPYLRCLCHYRAANGCTGNIIWFDHAVYYMLNHLDKFFPDSTYPTLVSKYGAFLIWMGTAGRSGVKCQLTFMQSRIWMLEGVLQMAHDPEGELFQANNHMPGLQKIERLLKPASFSIANPMIPTTGPPGKKTRLNLNAPASAPNQSGYKPPNTGFGRGRGRGQYARGGYGGRGRGRYSRDNSPRHYNMQTPTPRHVEPVPATPTNIHTFVPQPSSVLIKDIRAPATKTKFCSFDDDD